MRTASLNISTVVINAMLAVLLVAAALVAAPAHAQQQGGVIIPDKEWLPYPPRAEPAPAHCATTYAQPTTTMDGRKVIQVTERCPGRQPRTYQVQAGNGCSVNCDLPMGNGNTAARQARERAQNVLNRN